MDLLFGLIFLFLIILGIFSFFEIAFIRIFFKIKSTKYIKLLKILEIFFFLMIFLGKILFIALTFLYFLVLISDFKKKIISREELIVNILFYFTDILLIIFYNIINFGKPSKYLNIYELKIKIQKGAIMILLFLLSFSILPIILTFLEIFFVKKVLTIKTMKYIKLLKIFEVITPFIALIISQGVREVIGMAFLVFFFLSLTYLGILIYDVFKGKIDGNEFTINFVFYFVDIILMLLSTLVSAKIIF
nr:hypothetical protein [Fusobacterium animalis]